MNDMSIESEKVSNPIEEVYVNLINIIFDLTYLSELSKQNILGSESSANQSM